MSKRTKGYALATTQEPAFIGSYRDASPKFLGSQGWPQELNVRLPTGGRTHAAEELVFTKDDVCSPRMCGSASDDFQVRLCTASKVVWGFDEEERQHQSVKIRGSVCLPIHLLNQARLQPENAFPNSSTSLQVNVDEWDGNRLNERCRHIGVMGIMYSKLLADFDPHGQRLQCRCVKEWPKNLRVRI